MYERMVLEPRLTAYWQLDSGTPLDPPLLEEIRLALGSRYGVSFDSAGFSVPRTAHAGPRISIAFRHGLDAHAYGR